MILTILGVAGCCCAVGLLFALCAVCTCYSDEKAYWKSAMEELRKPTGQVKGMTTSWRHLGRFYHDYKWHDAWWCPAFTSDIKGGRIISQVVGCLDGSPETANVRDLMERRTMQPDNCLGPLYQGMDKARELGCFLS